MKRYPARLMHATVPASTFLKVRVSNRMKILQHVALAIMPLSCSRIMSKIHSTTSFEDADEHNNLRSDTEQR